MNNEILMTHLFPLAEKETAHDTAIDTATQRNTAQRNTTTVEYSLRFNARHTYNGYIGGRHRFPPELLVLPGIPKVGNDRRDGFDGRPSQGRDHKDEFHDGIVAARGTNQIHVLAPDGFADFHPGFSVGKGANVHAVEIPSQQMGNVSPECFRAGTGQQNEFGLFLGFDLGRLVKIHLFGRHEGFFLGIRLVRRGKNGITVTVTATVTVTVTSNTHIVAVVV